MFVLARAAVFLAVREPPLGFTSKEPAIGGFLISVLADIVIDVSDGAVAAVT
jgi:hypothetical protein